MTVFHKILLTLDRHGFDLVCFSNDLPWELDKEHACENIYVQDLTPEEAEEISREALGDKPYGIVFIGTDFNMDYINLPQYSIKQMKERKEPPFDKSVSETTNFFKDGNMIVYFGESLNSLKEQKLKSVKKERSFVNKVRKYLRAPYREPLVIEGLRGTGKTTGVLQALPDDACYVQCEELFNGNNFGALNSVLDNEEYSCYVIDNGDVFRNKSTLFSFLAKKKCAKPIVIIQEEPFNYKHLGKPFENIIHTSVIDFREFRALSSDGGSYSEYSSSYGFFPGSEITDASLYFEESIVKRVFTYVRDMKFILDYSLVRQSIVRVFESLFSPGCVRFGELDMYIARVLVDMNVIHLVENPRNQAYQVFTTNPYIYYMYHRIYSIYDGGVLVSPLDIFRGIALNYMTKYGCVKQSDDPSVISLQRGLYTYKFFCKIATGFKHMGNLSDLIYVVEPDEEDSLDNEYVHIQDLDEYLSRLEECEKTTEFF